MTLKFKTTDFKNLSYNKLQLKLFIFILGYFRISYVITDLKNMFRSALTNIGIAPS